MFEGTAPIRSSVDCANKAIAFIRIMLLVVLALGLAVLSKAEDATLTRNSILRARASSSARIKAHLSASTHVTILNPQTEGGYYQVQTDKGEKGWVLARNVKTAAASQPATSGGTGPVTSAGPGTPGSSNTLGCGDGLWKHVYHPSRLIVKQDCITVTGVIVDATANQKVHHSDGVRHEPDGDTHGWLRLDPEFQNLLDAGNQSNEDGNLVFELVCHFSVTQGDAKPSCAGFHDSTTIPPVGAHVAIKGSFVQDTNHAQWNEIHPVSSINVQ